MIKLRICQLCGARIRPAVAAHECQHGWACRYLAGERGMPVDWRTPECPRCAARVVVEARQGRFRPALRLLYGGSPDEG